MQRRGDDAAGEPGEPHMLTRLRKRFERGTAGKQAEREGSAGRPAALAPEQPRLAMG